MNRRMPGGPLRIAVLLLGLVLAVPPLGAAAAAAGVGAGGAAAGVGARGAAAGVGAGGAAAGVGAAIPPPLPARELNVGAVAPIVAPDGSLYAWSTTADGGTWIVALDAAGRARPGWPVTLPGFGVPVVAPDGTLLSVGCEYPGPCSLQALTPAGMPRAGWPVVLPGTTGCDVPLPGPRADVFLVCNLGAARHVFRFAMTGRLQRGFPTSVTGETRAARLVGDVLYLVQDVALGPRVVAVHPDSTSRQSPTVPEVGDATGNAAGSRGFALAPDGTAFAWGYILQGPAAFGPTALRRSEIRAFNLAGTLPGWPYRTRLPMSAPAFGSSGVTYLTVGTATANGWVVALARSGHSVAGWPARLPVPAVTGHVGEGNLPFLDVPSPEIGSDGTVIVASIGGGGTTITALTPAGHIRAGWPFHSGRTLALACPDLLLEAGCGDPRLPIVASADGTAYVALAAGTPARDGGRIVALDPNGNVRAGWPITLAATSEVTSLTAGPGGRLAVAELDGPLASLSASLTLLNPAGGVRYRATLLRTVSAGTSVTLADDGSTLNLHVGDRFLLDLGPGFTWTVTIAKPAILSRVLNITVIAGAQGVYEATGTGHTTLTAVGDPLCRASLPPCGAPSRLFSLAVVIAP